MRRTPRVLPRPGRGRVPARRPWSALVAVVTLLAGMLFATSATTAQGTDLRAGRRRQLAELVRDRQRRLAGLDAEAAGLRTAVEAATETAATRDERVRAATAEADRLAGPAGLRAVTGPGVEVSLDDAPRPDDGEPLPEGARPDDLVVHEQDVHAVLNALWAGGAEAVTVMGDRIVATSAVRCVGNTLLLHGAVYSPPFVLRAIGDADALVAALDRAPGVRVFKQYVDRYGLGYDVRRRDRIAMPAYDGPLLPGRRAG